MCVCSLEHKRYKLKEDENDHSSLSLLCLCVLAQEMHYGPPSYVTPLQVLAMASRMKKDSLRLVHLPSLTVFSNFPTGRSPLHFVHCLAFSPKGGFLAIGNAKGRVLLYRLHHYVDV